MDVTLDDLKKVMVAHDEVEVVLSGKDPGMYCACGAHLYLPSGWKPAYCSQEDWDLATSEERKEIRLAAPSSDKLSSLGRIYLDHRAEKIMALWTKPVEINPNQHCTSKECPFTQSHTANFCGYEQTRQCDCHWDYPERGQVKR